MRIYLALIGAFLLTGCVSMVMEKRVSGSIGCPPEEIKIREATQDFLVNTYTATCRGKLFYCSAYHSNVLFFFPVTTYSCARSLPKDGKSSD